MAGPSDHYSANDTIDDYTDTDTDTNASDDSDAVGGVYDPKPAMSMSCNSLINDLKSHIDKQITRRDSHYHALWYKPVMAVSGIVCIISYMFATPFLLLDDSDPCKKFGLAITIFVAPTIYWLGLIPYLRAESEEYTESHKCALECNELIQELRFFRDIYVPNVGSPDGMSHSYALSRLKGFADKFVELRRRYM